MNKIPFLIGACSLTLVSSTYAMELPLLSSVTSSEIAKSMILNNAIIDLPHDNRYSQAFDLAFRTRDRQALLLVLKAVYCTPTAEAITQALMEIRCTNS